MNQKLTDHQLIAKLREKPYDRACRETAGRQGESPHPNCGDHRAPAGNFEPPSSDSLSLDEELKERLIKEFVEQMREDCLGVKSGTTRKKAR